MFQYPEIWKPGLSRPQILGNQDFQVPKSFEYQDFQVPRALKDQDFQVPRALKNQDFQVPGTLKTRTMIDLRFSGWATYSAPVSAKSAI